MGSTLLSPKEMDSCNPLPKGENTFIFPLSLGGSVGALLASHMQLSKFLRMLREGSLFINHKDCSAQSEDKCLHFLFFPNVRTDFQLGPWLDLDNDLWMGNIDRSKH